MTSGMTEYTSHLADGGQPDYTLCREPWQGWQAPHTETMGRDRDPLYRVLPPHDQPERGDAIRQCQACFHAARNVRP